MVIWYRLPPLPAVPGEFNMGVVAALARWRGAAGLLVGEIDQVVVLIEFVQSVFLGGVVGRLAAHVRVIGIGQANGEGNSLAGPRERLRCFVAQN